MTASAGIAGWTEFYLLRRAITVRIGRTGLPPSALAKLWGASLSAGAAGYGVMHLLIAWPHVLRGVASLGAFASVYGLLTIALGIPEARGLVTRVMRR